MKATLTSLLLVLVTGAVLAQAPQADVAAQEASFYAGVLDTVSLRAAVERSTARADTYLKALLDVQGARMLDNTLVPYDRLGMEIESAARLTTIVSRLHPDERMRTAAEELAQALAARRASLALRPDIYTSAG